MSVRTPIQVPMELKEKVEDLKSRFFVSTNYEVIGWLISKLNEYDKFQIEEGEKWRKEKQRQQFEDVNLGEDLKKKLAEFQEHVGLGSPAQAIEFLLEVFESSPTIGRIAFSAYVKMRKP